MTGPREWRHASDCSAVEVVAGRRFSTGRPCTCGLSAVRDAITTGHRVVIGQVHGVAGRCACGFPERHTNLPCSR